METIRQKNKELTFEYKHHLTLTFDSNDILETIVTVPNMKQFFQSTITRVVRFTSRKIDSEYLPFILRS